MNTGRCRSESCGATVQWAKAAGSGRLMPFDVDATPDGQWAVSAGVARHLTAEERAGFPGDLYSCHFATCPDAASWRSKR
jgi:hypothetical protein